MKPDHTAAWVREARRVKGWTQGQMGEALNVTKANVSGWENGRHNPNFAQMLAIANLTGHPLEKHPEIAANGMAANVVPVAGRGAVPLISWVQAGSWNDVSDPFQPGVADDWLPCPVKHGPRTYCVKVRGESMENKDERPTYSDGDVIFVDPDAVVNPKDRVIVRLDDEQQVTFKQYLEEGGRRYLKALNPSWVPRYIDINGNATICGKVIGKWVPE